MNKEKFLLARQSINEFSDQFLQSRLIKYRLSIRQQEETPQRDSCHVAKKKYENHRQRKSYDLRASKFCFVHKG